MFIIQCTEDLGITILDASGEERLLSNSVTRQRSPRWISFLGSPPLGPRLVFPLSRPPLYPAFLYPASMPTESDTTQFATFPYLVQLFITPILSAFSRQQDLLTQLLLSRNFSSPYTSANGDFCFCVRVDRKAIYLDGLRHDPPIPPYSKHSFGRKTSLT
jgi:hypothetical protein